MELSITASYAFFSIEEAELTPLRQKLLAFGKEREMGGLVLIAPEGINSTVSGTEEAIAQWKEHLTQKFGPIVFKDSSAQKKVFKRWSVKIKPEIVVIKDSTIHPQGKHKHLSPQEFQNLMEQEDVIVLDARNAYEVAIGKFKSAVDPKIQSFYQFPEFVEKSQLPKDKKILMYCTGGIRCEKALISMEAQGYENVYQLEGGILAYLQQFPQKDFEGECFVFDHRVAVDQHLNPSEVYELCPHCGDPGAVQIMCSCGASQKVCECCHQDETQRTCSKRCRNEMRNKLLMSSLVSARDDK
jgi:UPF0176 protein